MMVEARIPEVAGAPGGTVGKVPRWQVDSRDPRDT